MTRNEILAGDCRDTLAHLPDGSVNVIVTSPPYWGLRQYAGDFGVVWGGDPGCEHQWGSELPHGRRGNRGVSGTDGNLNPALDEDGSGPGSGTSGTVCTICGAWHGSLGAEPLHDCLAWARGEEPCPQCFVCHIRTIARELWRVLRDDGILWLNLGDSFAGGGYSNHSGTGGAQRENGGKQKHTASSTVGLKPTDLCGIPQRAALALQADGWYWRSDVVWCLSGGAYVYARTQKGEQVCMVRDLARLDPETVELWNGEKWTRLLGMNKSKRTGGELELTLMSGERISCTPTHKWPTRRGLIEASELVPGDVIEKTLLPEPDIPRDCAIDEDAAWLAGLYIAEGSRSGRTIQIAGHSREDDRWDRCQRVAQKFGGHATRTVAGNSMEIRLYGKLLFAILDELVSGRVAKDKCFSPVVWRYSNQFIASMVDGYLAGDGHFDAKNRRWRLGFTRNYNLERDLRTACARLGYKLSLKLAEVAYDGRMVPTFRGELRKETSGHHNEHDTGEIVKIGKAKCREVYDLGVEDEPHLYALASGVLTHNSKPNPMPESTTSRPAKSHEHILMLTKRPGSQAFFDMEAVKERVSVVVRGARLRMSGRRATATPGRAAPSGNEALPSERQPMRSDRRNLRDVWTISTQGMGDCMCLACRAFYTGTEMHRLPKTGGGKRICKCGRSDAWMSHFAAYPQELVRRCLNASTSARGYCAQCGAPWKRIIERGNSEHHCRPGCGCGRGEKPGDPSVQNWDDGWKGYGGFHDTSRDTGQWAPTCSCNCPDTVPGLVLDPFMGSGTTAIVAQELGLDWIGCEQSSDYVELAYHRIRVAREKLTGKREETAPLYEGTL